MSEWKEYNLTDVCDTISDTYKDGATKVVLVNTSDVLEGKVTNHEFVLNKNLAGQFKKKFQKDDILYSEIRPANRRYAYVDFESKDYIASTKLMVLRNKPCISPKYLYYLLTNNTTIHNLHAIAVGRSGTFPQITYSELANIKFKLPSLDEQDKILTTLLYFDDKIAVNRRICENLEAQAQALFKHWFIDFAPFKNGKFVESELGMIPEGWRVGRIEDLCSKIGSGGTPKSSNKDYYLGKIPWFGTGEFNDSFLFDSIKHITEEAVNNSSARFYPIHTVLIAMYGATVGKLSILSVEATFNQAALGMVAKETIGYPFVYLTLLRNRKQLVNLACGAAQQNLNAGNIKTYVSIIPPKHVMNDFNNVIMPIFDLIEKQNAESSRLSTLRDTLLPKLMSGQIKV